MKTKLWILVLAALPPAAATASQFHRISPVSCVNSVSGTTDDQRSVSLVNWNQSSSKTYACAIDLTTTTISPITVDPSTVRVDYYDSNAVTTYSVGCEIAIVNSSATIVTSPWQYGCSVSGGCSSAPSGYTGAGFLTIPDSIASTANVVGMSVICSIPYWDASGGTSIVYGIGASTATP